VPITSKSSNFKGATQHHVVKMQKSAGARQYCRKILRVPGTLGTRANSSPVTKAELLQEGIIFLIHLFARAILLMKKLKIEETKAT
jgi:hypothetical protein